jgi:SAM-dependent methyltransferase
LTEAARENLAYYGAPTQGREDYWRHMAAPRHRVRVLLRELERLAPASVVDLGCGNGALLDEVRARLPAASLAGVDLSPEQVALNRARAPQVAWHAMDLDGDRDVPAPLAGAFDAVVATEVIEHVDDPAGFLRTARRFVRAGSGALLLSTQSGRVGETERRVGHRRHFTREEMRDLLAASGWTPVRVWNTGFPFHDLSKWWANRDPDASMSRFGDRAYGPRERAICALLRAAFRLNSSRRGAQLFALARSV